MRKRSSSYLRVTFPARCSTTSELNRETGFDPVLTGKYRRITLARKTLLCAEMGPSRTLRQEAARALVSPFEAILSSPVWKQGFPEWRFYEGARFVHLE